MSPLVRGVGPWTIQKLGFLREYLAAYVKATKRITKSDVCFMDLFAGPGRDQNRETGEVVDGSPLQAMALYPGFRRFIFIDIQPTYARQLRELAFERRLDKVTHVLTGDCNVLIEEALKFVPKDGSTFCFVDPAGVDVSWKTVRCIAQHKPRDKRKIELFILFPYDMALVRFLARDRDPRDVWGPDVEKRIDLAMPDINRWRRVYQDRNDEAISVNEARRRFAYIYWMGLRELDYEFVLKPKLLSSSRGHPLYFLFFASDHQAGERIMSHVLTKPRSFEQLQLPILENPWDFKEGEEWYQSTQVTDH